MFKNTIITDDGYIQKRDIISYIARWMMIFIIVFFSTISIIPSVGVISTSHQANADDSSKYIVGEEVIEARQETSKTYYRGESNDGKYKYAIDSYIGAIHYKADYKDEGSPWLDIDTNIVDGVVTKAPYNLSVYLIGEPGFYIEGKNGGEYYVRLKAARVSDLIATEISPDTKVVSKIEGNKVIWENYYPDVDVVLTASNDGVHFDRIIKTATAPKEYDVTINELEKGTLALLPIQSAIDATGQELLMEEKPIADGRTETLKLQVISKDVKTIVYPITDAIDVQVGFSADDGMVKPSTSSFWGTETINSVGQGVATAIFHSFYLFQGITIAQSSNITSCNVSLYENGSGGSPLTKIYFEKANNPTAVTSSADYATRALTAGVDWDGDPGANGWYDSPSLVVPMQELVNAYNLVSDNVQMMHMDDGSDISNARDSRSWDYSGNTYGAKLHIEYSAAPATAVLTGTAVPTITEANVVTSGKTIIITLTGDTWVATVGVDNAITTALIAGIDSAQSEATGWDAVVKANMVFGDVVRTSDTIVTVTLGDEATYDITATETITVTIPATAVTLGAQIVATPTFTVTVVVALAVTTNAATSVEEETATWSADITSATSNATEWGFDWGTSTGSYSGNWTTTGSQGVGNYTHGVTGLTKGDEYFIRAKVYNVANGWKYDGEVTCITKPDPATSFVSTDNGTGWLTYSWTNGTGMDSVTLRYSSVSYPTLISDGSQGYSGSGTSANVTGLSANTTYYARLFTQATEGGLTSTADSNPTALGTTDVGLGVNATTVGSISLEKTFKCISASANYSGDADADNSAIVEYRTGGGAWIQGMDLYNDTYASSPWQYSWRGSIVGLTSNTTYEVRITFTDGDGVSGTNPLSANVTTLEDIIPASLGSTYYVSVSGNDTNVGSYASPWLTIGYATTTAAGGSKIRVLAGTYWGESSIIPNSGTSGNYTTIEAYDPANKPLITGADLTIYTNSGNTTWTATGNGTMYKTTIAFTPYVIVMDSTRLYHYQVEVDWGTRHASIDGGWYFDGATTLYVDLPDGSNPNTHVMWVGRYQYGINATDKDYLNIKNLQFRDYSTAIEITSATYLNVISCDFYYHVVGINSWTNGDNTHDIRIEYCTFEGGSDFGWNWNWMHNGQGHGDATAIYSIGISSTGYNVVIRNNTVSNCFEGPIIQDIYFPYRSYNNDFYENTMNYISDDAIMPSRIQTRVFDNIVNHAIMSGVTVNYAYSGPLYVFHNKYYDCTQGAYKIGHTELDAGVTYVYNDSFYSTIGMGFYVATDSGTGAQIIARNNAAYVIRHVAEVASVDSYSLDYDCLYSTSGTDYVHWGGGSYLTIAAWYAAKGQEEHGIQANPLFTDPANGDFSLQVGSPCTDNGTIITGFNDTGDPFEYSGTAPDIGAEEYDVGLPSVTTNAATLVEETTATLNGDVNNVGSDNVTRWFFWDTDLTSPYSENWSEGIYGTGEYSYNVPVLNKGDKYVIVASANNTTGQIYGSPAYMMTKPDGATGFISTDNGTDWITLSWTNGTGMDSVTIRYDSVGYPVTVTDGSFGYFGVGTTANVSGLSANTTYFFSLFTQATEDGTTTTADTTEWATDITDAIINNAPVLVAIGNKNVNENVLLQFTANATDADLDPLVYSIVNNPAGSDYNATNGLFTWIPDYIQSGVYPDVQFIVSDGLLTDSENITITVTNVNRAPVLGAIGNKTVTENSTLTFTITANDPDTDPVSYNATNLPIGASFNIGTQVFLWIPSDNQSGVYPDVGFQVTDGSLSDSENITITVYEFGTAPIVATSNPLTIIAIIPFVFLALAAYLLLKMFVTREVTIQTIIYAAILIYVAVALLGGLQSSITAVLGE